MQPAPFFAACMLATLSLPAQETAEPPYQTGDVQGFLARARADARPAIVLYNFDLESG